MDNRPLQNGRPFDNGRLAERGRTQFAPTDRFGETGSINNGCRGELCSPADPTSPAVPIPPTRPNPPVRKRNRLQGYDYSQQGAYFITVCAQHRAELFGQIVGATCGRPLSNTRPYTELSDLGRIVQNEIEILPGAYAMVFVDAFVIMPNHVHMILVIDGGRSQIAPTRMAGKSQSIKDGCRGELCSPAVPSISRIIKQWKGAITKRIGLSPWQKSFHDHVIRNEGDYLQIALYVENNPAQWEMDSLHPKHR